MGNGSAGAQAEGSPKYVSPTLFVGLGGTGCEIVGRIKDRHELLSRYVDRPDLQFVNYVGFDTRALINQTPTVQRFFGEQAQGPTSATYFYLGGFNGWEYLQGQYYTPSIRDANLAQWWDPRLMVENRLIDDGAGRVRLLGRLCLQRHRVEVSTLLRSKLADLFSLREISRANVAPSIKDAPPQIIIVAGTAGGTGCGTFLDISYMAYNLAYSVFSAPPRTTAVLMLPGLYVSKAKGTSLDMATSYNANAGALFTEIEHYLQRPEDMEQHRLDAARNDFVSSGRWVPFDNCYLVSESIEGGGRFEEFRDLYAYATRAIYQVFLTPEDTDTGGIVDNQRLARSVVAGLARCPAYSTFGFSSIEHPTEVLLGYVADAYARRMIDDGLGEPRDKSKQQLLVRKAGAAGASWWAAVSERHCTQLFKSLESVRSEYCARIPSRIVPEGAKPPSGDELARLVAEVVASADSVVQAGIQRIRDAYSRAALVALEGVQASIHQAVDSPSGGFYYTHQLLVAAQAEVRRLVESYDKQLAQFARSAEQAATDLANADPSGVQAQFRAKPGNRTREKALVNTIRNQAVNTISAEAFRCAVRVLRQVAGPLASTRADVGDLQRLTGGEVSLLEKAIVAVEKLVGELAGWRLSLDRELDGWRKGQGGRMEELGLPLTTTYLPSPGAGGDLWTALEAECLGPIAAPDDVLAEMAELRKEWARVDPSALAHDGARTQQLIAAIRAAARARAAALFHNAHSTDVSPLIGTGQARVAAFQRLAALASPCVGVRTDIIPESHDGLLRIRAVGSSGLAIKDEVVEAAAETGVTWGHTPLDAQQVSILHMTRGFPVVAVDQMREPQAEYIRRLATDDVADPTGRDLPWLPHSRREWNNPEGCPVPADAAAATGQIDQGIVAVYATGRAIANAMNAMAADGALRSQVEQAVARVVAQDPFDVDPGPVRWYLAVELIGREWRLVVGRFRPVPDGGRPSFGCYETLALEVGLWDGFAAFRGGPGGTENMTYERMQAAFEETAPDVALAVYRAYVAALRTYFEKRKEAAGPVVRLEKALGRQMLLQLTEAIERIDVTNPPPPV